MSNYTKGKWKLTEDKLGIATKERGIADCYFRTPTHNVTESVANAKRICQCVNNFDELLEALKAILNTETMLTAVHAMDKSYEIAKQAIAKAEGEK